MSFLGDPIKPVHGGTGVASPTPGGVLIGQGANPMTSVAPGTLGNTLQSDGTQWISAAGGGTGSSIHTPTEKVTNRLFGAYAQADYQDNLQNRLTQLPY